MSTGPRPDGYEYALDLEKENVEKHVAVILGGEESSGELLRTGAG
jgi:hypothetical protein